MVEQTQKQLLEQSPVGKGSGTEAKPKPELSSPSSSPTMDYSPSTPTSRNAPGERATVDQGLFISAEEQQALEVDAMREPSPSAMLAGVHVTRYRPQDCACRGRHEHRYGYTQDCAVLDCTCVGASS